MFSDPPQLPIPSTVSEEQIIAWWFRYPEERTWLLKDKYSWSSEKLLTAEPNQVSPEIHADLARLASGEPLAYVIGWTPFLGLHIDLRYRTLIPRPETEYWVGQMLKETQWSSGEEVLDMCSGSGCIGVAVAKHRPDAHITFVDVDEAAIQQTHINVEVNQVAGSQPEIVQSDLFTRLGDKQFDLILTNPPYVDLTRLPAPELAHEPAVALFARDHGFAIIARIVEELPKRLKPKGMVWMECDPDQPEKIAAILDNRMQMHVLNDQFKQGRVVKIGWK